MQVSIINGSIEYDGNPILSEINFNVHEKEKIALVGRNGCGKTSLLKALTGENEMLQGTGDSDFGFYKTGNPVIGFLKQNENDAPGKTMEDDILEAYSEITSIEKSIEKLQSKMETDPTEANVSAYSSAMERFEILGGYTYKKEYLTAVRKFGFSDDDLKKTLNTFSGGQRTRISLLKLLLSKPDILLLDEPTNHLDLEAIEWLERYLSGYEKSCVIVSHDRMFLDKIVNIVYEIEYGEMTRYKGNYTSFMQQKKAAYDKACKDSLAKKKEIERLSALVEKFRYKKSKAAFAQAKLTQIKRMGTVDIPTGFDNSTFKASFQPEKETVEKAIELNKLSFGYNESDPLGYIDMLIKRGDKVGILGANGCGKSTLVKTIMHRLQPLSGSAAFGLHANVGYFDQKSTQSYSSSTVFDDFQSEFPMLNDRETRTVLGAFLFSGDDVFKSVGDLSGGEKVRLALCKIFRKKPNILILDEPTNHMDIIGKETLESMLSEYKGTVITVSHDRYFINRICNRLIIFDGNTAEIFNGNYTQYLEAKEEAERKEAALESGAHNETAASKANSPSGGPTQAKPSEAKKKRPETQGRIQAKKNHRIEVLEEKIAAIDAQINEKKTSLSDPAVFSDYSEVERLTAEINRLEAEKAPFEEEWFELID